jgi:hypothetical protein
LKFRVLEIDWANGEQICAIAAKTRLAQKPIGIEVPQLNDPADFITYLDTTYSIMKYTIFFSIMNPFDTDEDWHKPMEWFVQEAEASRGKTTITGQNLNPTILKDLTRSAAASGDNATASMKMQEDAQPINRQLQGNAVNFSMKMLKRKQIGEHC